MENMELIFAETFRDKKVFVTGHTGFKGSWLVSWLHLLGAEVKGYALAPENDFDLYHVINGDLLCNSVIADIRDSKLLQNEIVSFQPDFIFHLAAQPLVRLSYQIPVETFDINTTGTAHVLDALRFLKKPCVAVMITTDKVYRNLESDHLYVEEDRLGGYDPYSASKAAAELVIASYRSSFFSPENYAIHQKSISVARAGNVIGGGDWAKARIIPDVIRSLQKGEPVLIRNPLSVRPWQHVLESLSGYLSLAAKQVKDPKRFATAYNFGPLPEDDRTVEDIVKLALQLWGADKYIIADNKENKLHETGLLKLDVNKAIKEIEWKPRYSAAKAVSKTIDWYKKYLQDTASGYQLVLNDIKNYLQ